MKIVLLCGYYYPKNVGGTEAYVQMLGQELQEYGHEVTIVSPSTTGNVQTYSHEDLEVFRYPVAQDPSRAEAQGKVEPEYLDVWADWLDTTQPDIVHMHSLTRGCSVFHAEAVVDREIPLYVTVHVPEVTCPRGTMMRWGDTPCDGEVRPVRCGACVLQQRGLPKPIAWAAGLFSSTGIGASASGRVGTLLGRGEQIRRRKQQFQSWLRSAERVIVYAEWLKDVLVRNDVSPEHVTLSRQGLSEEMRSMQHAAAERRSSRRASGTLTVGFVGRITEVKGIHVLVEAACTLPEEVELEIHIYGITGNKEDEAYLKDLEERSSKDQRVKFLGPLTDDNRVNAFASFDMLAVPSLWFETGPYTVLEAFAADLPVLGSNHGGIEESVEHGKSGVLVPPGNVEAWRKALHRLVEKHESGDWNWKLPEPWTSQEITRKMEEMYLRQ